MRRRTLLGQAALAAFAASAARAAAPAGAVSLAPLLQPLLAEHGLPALAAAAVQDAASSLPARSARGAEA
jgi:hypothetical protein